MQRRLVDGQIETPSVAFGVCQLNCHVPLRASYCKPLPPGASIVTISPFALSLHATGPLIASDGT
jgi:hypothetical protein